MNFAKVAPFSLLLPLRHGCVFLFPLRHCRTCVLTLFCWCSIESRFAGRPSGGRIGFLSAPLCRLAPKCSTALFSDGLCRNTGVFYSMPHQSAKLRTAAKLPGSQCLRQNTAPPARYRHSNRLPHTESRMAATAKSAAPPLATI